MNNTVRESVGPQQVAGGKARIPYAARLRTLIDSVAIALVRAQMDLVDTYVIVCVKGHGDPPSHAVSVSDVRPRQACTLGAPQRPTRTLDSSSV